jgi:two-component sensor histidine kinase
VSGRWDLTGTDAASTLTIMWRELGGPPIVAPVRSGYGLSLVCDLTPHELGGTVELIFPPDGPRCKIEISSRGEVRTLARRSRT